MSGDASYDATPAPDWPVYHSQYDDDRSRTVAHAMPAQAYDLPWLGGLRWTAVCTVLAVGCMGHWTGLVDTGVSIALVALLLGFANAGFSYLASTRAYDAQDLVFAQLNGDVVALTALLHLAGGIGNPMTVCYAFLLALAAIYLDNRRSILVAAVATFYSGLLVCADLLTPFHSTTLRWTADAVPHGTSVGSALAHLGAAWVMMWGVLMFVRVVRDRQAIAETGLRQHVAVSAARDRMARVGAIAAGVAHAVRNPLHGALNCHQLIESTAPAAADRDVLDMLRDSLRRIDAVTRRLLTLGRADQDPRITPVDISSVIQSVAPLARTRARQHGLELRWEQAPPLEVIVDADRISEAVLNIIDNAIDASPEGSAIDMRVRRGPGVVQIIIRDYGAGIPESLLPQIFDPFFTTKPVERGTGLGMAIANRVFVEEHGGALAVASLEGEGTEVTASIPAPGLEAMPT